MSKRKREGETESAQDTNPREDNDREPKAAKQTFELSIEGKKPIECEGHGNAGSKPDLIFTHGAGGDLKAPAMQDFAAGFAESSSLVMFKGNLNLKARVSSFQKVVEHEDCSPALGGRSMGARAACLAAQASEGKINTLILVSFPLVGAAKQDSREQILLDLPEGVDVLFISGTEDTMCDLDQLREVEGRMKARSWVLQVEGADHGMAMKPKEASQPMRVKTGEVAAEWLKSRDGSKRFRLLDWEPDEQRVIDEGWIEEDSTMEGVDAAPVEEDQAAQEA